MGTQLATELWSGLKGFPDLEIKRSVILFIAIFVSWASGARTYDVHDLDILELPRLSKKLSPGTLAWATVDQLHPMQPQTGLREVLRKTDDFVELLQRARGKFPDELFETMLKRNYIIPVYLGNTPGYDSRYGREEILAYGTDRTHKASALAYAYRRVYGLESLSEPVFSKRGRPLNVVLVRVMENKTDLSAEQFAKKMIQDRHVYLEQWSRGKKGGVQIDKITFPELPEKVYETGDNPFRGVIGALQHQGWLERIPVDFSQFALAKKLAQSGVVNWDDISLEATSKRYKGALERAADFFAEQSQANKQLIRGCQRLLTAAFY